LLFDALQAGKKLAVKDIRRLVIITYETSVELIFAGKLDKK